MRRDAPDHYSFRVRPGLRVEIPSTSFRIPERPNLLWLARDLVADQGLAIDEVTVVRRDRAVDHVRASGGIAAAGGIGRIRRIGSIVGTVNCDSVSGAVVVVNPICLRVGGGIVDGGSPNVVDLTTITSFVAAGERHGQSGHEGPWYTEKLHVTYPTERETRMACRTP